MTEADTLQLARQIINSSHAESYLLTLARALVRHDERSSRSMTLTQEQIDSATGLFNQMNERQIVVDQSVFVMFGLLLAEVKARMTCAPASTAGEGAPTDHQLIVKLRGGVMLSCVCSCGFVSPPGMDSDDALAFHHAWKDKR